MAVSLKLSAGQRDVLRYALVHERVVSAYGVRADTLRILAEQELIRRQFLLVDEARTVAEEWRAQAVANATQLLTQGAHWTLAYQELKNAERITQDLARQVYRITETGVEAISA